MNTTPCDNPTWRESGNCELAWQSWQAALVEQALSQQDEPRVTHESAHSRAVNAALSVDIPNGTPLYTTPQPNTRAVLNQALEALCLPCARWNKTQTKIVNAAIAAIREQLGATP